MIEGDLKPTTSILRLFALCLAIIGYSVNGAQAHVRMAGETMAVPMCGDGMQRVVHIEVGQSVPVDTGSDTCCGDCTLVAVDVPSLPRLVVPVRVVETSAVIIPEALVIPGSPLWPGAPPQGPPLTFKA